jgi:hypothetical protein
MCVALLPPGGYPTAVKYIVSYISYMISYFLLTIGCFWTMKIIYFLKINLAQALATHKNKVNSKELKWWKVFIAREELNFLVLCAQLPVCRLLSFPILVCYLNHFSQQRSRNKRKPTSRINFDRLFSLWYHILCAVFLNLAKVRNDQCQI